MSSAYLMHAVCMTAGLTLRAFANHERQLPDGNKETSMSDTQPSHSGPRAPRRISIAMATIAAGIAASLLAVPATPAQAVCSSIPSAHDLNVIRIVYQVGLNLRVSSKVMLAGFEAGW